jgi:hypothetical protein
VRLPTVGILVDGPTPAPFSDFVAELSRWCVPVAWRHGMGLPVAWITNSLDITAPAGRPTAIWTDGGVEVGGTTIPFDARIDIGDAVALTPFVRSRYRRGRGLPDDLVVDLTSDAIPNRLRTTAIAAASAAIAIGEEALVHALSWGTPTVTDRASADAIGAHDGVHVVITDDRHGAALALGRDHRKATALGRAGRRLLETRFDRVAPARRVAALLGLRGITPEQRVDAVLDELATPVGARIRARARTAVAT